MQNPEKKNSGQDKFSESLVKRFFKKHAKELSLYQTVFFHDTEPDYLSGIEKNAALGKLTQLDTFHNYDEISSRLQRVIVDLFQLYQHKAIEMGKPSINNHSIQVLIDLVLFFEWQMVFGPRRNDEEESPYDLKTD
jgi:hypothetical protein